MNTNSCSGTWWKKPWGILGITVAGGLFVYLVIFRWPYVAAYWPFLFLLACPLSHLFMHHGHDGKGGHGCCGGGQDEADQRPNGLPGEKQ